MLIILVFIIIISELDHFAVVFIYALFRNIEIQCVCMFTSFLNNALSQVICHKSVSQWSSLEPGIWPRRSIYSLWKWEGDRWRKELLHCPSLIPFRLEFEGRKTFDLAVHRDLSVLVFYNLIGRTCEGKGTRLSVCGVWTHVKRQIMALIRLCCLFFLLYPLSMLGQHHQINQRLQLRQLDGNLTSFSPTCLLSKRGELVCDQCQPGYTGPRCDR